MKCLLALLLVAGLADALTLCITADTHIYGQDSAARAVVAAMAAENPDAVAIVGDLTNNGCTADWLKFHAIYDPLLVGAAWLPVIGDHDARNLPNWFLYARADRYYTARFGTELAVHALDCKLSLKDTGAQLAWLTAELIEDSLRGVRHILALYHYPLRTSTGGPGDTATLRVLRPLFERFHVTPLSGHAHCYEHNRDGAVSSLRDGTHYFTVGCGGGVLSDSTGWPASQPWTVYREATWGFILLEIDGDVMRLTGVRADGTRFDPTEIRRATRVKMKRENHGR